MSRARTLADQFNSDGDLALTPVASVNASQIGGRRNLIINGAMQIFQRATSASNPGGGYDAADRWRQSQNNTGLDNFTIEQSTDAPDGFATSLKLTKSGAITVSSTQSAFIQQYFEGQNLQQLQYGGSGAKKVTLSFYVKSSLTGTWGVCLQDGEAGKHNVQTYTISSANTWEYKTVTFDGDTAAGIANDNSAEFDVQFVLGAGSNYQTATTGSWQSGDKKTTSSQTQWPETNGATWFVTGVQLELGDTATDFEHRSYGEELALCQRYFWKRNGPILGWRYAGQANNISKIDDNAHPVAMRTSPTMSHNLTGASAATNPGSTVGAWSFYIQNAGWASATAQSTGSIGLLNFSSVTSTHYGGGIYWYYPSNGTQTTHIWFSSGSYIQADAEL